MSPTEYVDVVDGDDNIVGRATRGEVHEKGLIHRSVMFFLFDEAGRVLVNKRSGDKEFFGGLWSIVLGGHVSSGQTYDEAVRREAREEAQVTSEPFRMGSFKKRLPEESENVAVYGFQTDGNVDLLADEIEYGEFMDLEQARDLMENERFLPETRNLLPIVEDYLARRRRI